ncbi:MAG: YggS family pyridoxal phosphate-dependent enzyme [Candidatus Abyssobacteria bacterium SURF_5]|uniref:Pyridoxal phosphate homeostasis protein n=1 Tax=Abyssobacteria bacterium (strain SURF_5) TaxID=2093360 RepID=A0A3A4N6S8_ABYX5|nr:MAG: YggS family pyridoxal phosphate-dependent enzyme [Candidatus Abyssubacteria bacterium SURF_5]
MRFVMSIQSNLENLRRRISDAAQRAGRNPADIKLCVVTKTIPVARIQEAIACGVSIIGENRVHEATQKQPALGRSVEWHMIGHLQSRKARQAVELFDMVQSVDSVSTAAALEKRCAEIDRPMRVLIEVNTSHEEQKYGAPPADAERLVRQLGKMGHLRIEGLMTMAPLVSDPELARPCFRELRQTAQRLREQDFPGASFDVLSMGMSNDFEVAVEEGATLLRIGSAVFAK